MYNPFAKQKLTPIREYATPFAAFDVASAEVEKAWAAGQTAERYITTFDGYAWLLSDRKPVVQTRSTRVYLVKHGARAEELLPADLI